MVKWGYKMVGKNETLTRVVKPKDQSCHLSFLHVEAHAPGRLCAIKIKSTCAIFM